MIPLFIGGTGRSGTTITLEYLGNHSKIYASDPLEIRLITEKHGLLDLFETKDINSFNDYFNNKWVPKTKQTIGLNNSINKEKLNDIINKLNKNVNEESIKSFYFDIMTNQNLFKKGCQYLGDSTPSNIRYSHRIKSILPDSKFIHLFRDGRDSAYSIYKMKDFFSVEGSKNEFDCLDWWYNRIIDSFESLDKIDSKNHISVRLEDFVINDPNIIKNNMLNFLNINNEDMLEKYFVDNIKKDNISIGKWKELNSWKEFDQKYSYMIKELKNKNIIIDKYY
jgi:hypothetical protein